MRRFNITGTCTLEDYMVYITDKLNQIKAMVDRVGVSNSQ